ncbi:hypothetical protein BH11PAT4_BH11PAT4_5000 [soil metagenome]
MTLYRQHRPKRFSDLIGQKSAQSILQQAILKDRVAHAYLFSGPRGTGKTSTARIFARTLCCLSPVTAKGSIEACGTCSACEAISQGFAPDLLEIDAASNRGIEEMRTLREQAQYGPIQLSRKIYIVDEVHMLTTEAFNALLKTLEEPPAHCLFILATTDIHKLPATVRSRCQLIRFERASIESITQKLEKIVEANTLRVDASVLQVIAAAADGGFRDAETILEQLTTQHDHVTLPLAETALGTIGEAHLVQLKDAVLAGNLSDTTKVLRKSFSNPDIRFPWVLQELITMVRSESKLTPSHLTFLKNLLEAHVLQKSSPVASLPLEIACQETAAQLSGVVPMPVAALPRTSSPVTPEPPKTPPQKSPLPEKATTTPEVIAVTPKPTEPVSPVSVPVVELREAIAAPADLDIRKAWKECCEAVTVVSFPLSQLLRQAVFHVAEANTITIYVKYKFHADKLSEKKNVHLVQDKLKEITSFTWVVKYLVNQAIQRPEPKRQIGSTPNSDLSHGNASSVFSPAAP